MSSSSSASRLASFPQELVDAIVYHARNDMRSLKHCALVCRSWVTPCQSHLFTTMKVRVGIACRRSIEQLQQLLSLSPHLATYIRSLTIALHHGSDDSQHQLVLVLTRLCRLESLSIDMSFSPYFETAVSAELLVALRNAIHLPLRHLTIKFGKWTDISGFIALMGRDLPPLVSLELHGIRFDHDDVPVLVEGKPMELHTLRISHCVLPPLVDFFTVPGHRLRVRQLSLGYRYDHDPNSLLSIISHVTLEELDLYPGEFIDSYRMACDLGPLINLRKLSLPHCPSQLFQILSTIHPDNLIESITIRATSNVFLTFSSYDFLRRIEEVLMSSFPRLKSVTFHVDSLSTICPQFFDTLRTSMPNLLDGATLSVTTPTSYSFSSDDIQRLSSSEDIQAFWKKQSCLSCETRVRK